MPNLSLTKYFQLKEGQESLPAGTREMGLMFMLASLGMLFAAMLVGYFTVRWMAGEWPPPGTPELPAGLWAGTAALLLGSVTVQSALSGARSGNQARLIARLRSTLAFGILFLAVQTWNWIALVRAHGGPTNGVYGFLFFVLTMLHAVHVVGGILPLAIYWHFLGTTWLVLFAVLYLVDRP